MLCIFPIGDRDAAFRFGEFGLELIEQLQVREYIPRVYAAYYGCIYPWKYPLHDTLEHLLYAHRIGLQTGDIEFSCLCANLWCFATCECGFPLDRIETQWTSFYNSMQAYRQKSLLNMTIPTYMFVKFNRGEDVDFTELEKMLQRSIADGIDMTVYTIQWCKVENALLYNEYSRADETAIAAGLSKTFWKVARTADFAHIAFINGMVAFACAGIDYKGPRKRRRQQYLREGKAMIRILQKCSLSCPANFLHKKLILEALFAASQMKSDVAIEKYVCAIGMSRINGSFVLEACANELCARYYFYVLHQRHDAALYFQQAIFAFQEWKGQRKVDQLRTQLIELYGKHDYERYF
jgi:hypothetical protein